ncbi:hypothetical protein PCASD_03606 [Puccinia coronata f. sp. avenae]|uniref:Uncharacterized protein n=1 Tax=Puccinia coronata f. sp. avenae TaxID=200324 RepID=A0A2N5VDL6_9BASI|nr:hypothetical protein PCASD_03606 [Puccinia coronata f. sp. avenae]
MSESANNSPTATLSGSTEPTDVVPELIRERRGSIIQNFQNLRDKSQQYVPGNPIYPIVPVDTDREKWNEALSRLRLQFLPPLRHQIDTLIRLLHPSELQDDVDGSRLALIIDIQAELDQSLHEILTIATGIKDKPVSSPTRADDQDLQEFKEFTRQGLSSALKFLIHQVNSIFEQSSHVIKELTKPSTSTIESHQHLQSSLRFAILRRASVAATSIDRVIQWITADEFALIQVHWGSGSCDPYNEFLTDLPKLIYRAIHHLEPNYFNDGYTKYLKNEHALPLAHALTPLMKLSRLFFKKLVKDGLNQTPSKPYTDMNSYQLQTIGDSVGFIMLYLFHIMKSIAEYGTEYRHDEENLNPELIEGVIKKIIRRFDSNILLIITYIIPLISDSPSEPNQFQTYLVEWNSLFLIASQRCIFATQYYNAASQAAGPHE